jgi:hypothetical protein
VYDYLNDASKSRGLVERIASQILTLVLLVFIIGASVMVARAINWKELIGDVRSTGGSTDPAPVEKGKRKTRPPAPAKPRSNATRKPVKSTEDGKTLKPAEERSAVK